MDSGSSKQSPRHAERVRQLLGPAERLLAALERLVGIAQIPQGSTDPGEATHLGVRAIAKDLGRRRLSVIKGYPLLRMCSRLDKLARHQRRLRQHHMSPHEKTGIVQVLSQGQELLANLPRRL